MKARTLITNYSTIIFGAALCACSAAESEGHPTNELPAASHTSALTTGACQSKQDLLASAGCSVTASAVYHTSGVVTLKGYPSTADASLSLRDLVLFVSGFDSAGTLTTDDWAATANQTGLLDALRSNGRDVVVLNYGPHSGDYIQDSGLAMVSSLQTLQRFRTTNAQTLVVVGLSEGGLIARYALTQMEHANITHGVSTYVSYDTPHQGANVPVGLQYLPQFFSNSFSQARSEARDITNALSFALLGLAINAAPLDDPFHLNQTAASYATVLSFQLANGVSQAFSLGAKSEIGIGQGMLSSPAANQQLINYYQNSGSSPLRSQFMSELAALGNYPKKLRKVAISNGSVTGNAALGITPGAKLLSYRTTLSNPTQTDYALGFDVYATKTQPPSATFAGSMSGPHLQLFGTKCPVGTIFGHCPVPKVPVPPTIVSSTYDSESYTSNSGYREVDGVPGSFTPDIRELVDDFNVQAQAMNLQRVTWNGATPTFVPTYSSLDLDLSKFANSPSANFLQVAAANGASDLSRFTPFDRVYYPSHGFNEGHLTLSAEETNALYQEVINAPPPVAPSGGTGGSGGSAGTTSCDTTRTVATFCPTGTSADEAVSRNAFNQATAACQGCGTVGHETTSTSQSNCVIYHCAP